MNKRKTDNRNILVLTLLVAAFVAAGLFTSNGYCTEGGRHLTDQENRAASELSGRSDDNTAADAEDRTEEKSENNEAGNLEGGLPGGPAEVRTDGEQVCEAGIRGITEETENAEEIESAEGPDSHENVPGEDCAAEAETVMTEEVQAVRAQEKDVSDNDLPRSKPLSSGAVFGKGCAP